MLPTHAGQDREAQPTQRQDNPVRPPGLERWRERFPNRPQTARGGWLEPGPGGSARVAGQVVGGSRCVLLRFAARRPAIRSSELIPDRSSNWLRASTTASRAVSVSAAPAAPALKRLRSRPSTAAVRRATYSLSATPLGGRPRRRPATSRSASRAASAASDADGSLLPLAIRSIRE